MFFGPFDCIALLIYQKNKNSKDFISFLFKKYKKRQLQVQSGKLPIKELLSFLFFLAQIASHFFVYVLFGHPLEIYLR